MFGLSPKLPVRRDPGTGFALTKTYEEMIKQNLKNLVLTSPGERIMDINFGVGIRNYLFEQNVQEVYETIEERVREQAITYMPFVEIGRVVFFPGGPGVADQIRSRLNYDFDKHPNKLNITIEYYVVPMGVFNALDISVDLT